MAKWSLHPDTRKQVVLRLNYFKGHHSQTRSLQELQGCYKDTIFPMLED